MTLQADATPGTAGHGLLTVSQDAAVTIKNMTLRHGRGTMSSATIRSDGTLTLEDCTVTENHAPLGYDHPGIANTGTLTIVRSVLSDHADGRAVIMNIGPAAVLTVRDSTFRDNGVPGVRNRNGASVSLEGCTFVGNHTSGYQFLHAQASVNNIPANILKGVIREELHMISSGEWFTDIAQVFLGRNPSLGVGQVRVSSAAEALGYDTLSYKRRVALGVKLATNRRMGISAAAGYLKWLAQWSRGTKKYPKTYASRDDFWKFVVAAYKGLSGVRNTRIYVKEELQKDYGVYNSVSPHFSRFDNPKVRRAEFVSSVFR